MGDQGMRQGLGPLLHMLLSPHLLAQSMPLVLLGGLAKALILLSLGLLVYGSRIQSDWILK